MKRLLLTIIVFFILAAPCFGDKGYFDPISKEKQAVLRQIFEPTGVSLDKVTLYKTVSELKREGKYLKAIVHIRKKEGDKYVWSLDKGRENTYQSIVGGLRKKPRIVINEKGFIIAMTFGYVKKVFENSQLLSYFKNFTAISFFYEDYCNKKTINNLPKLNHLEYAFLDCKIGTPFPDLNKLSNLTHLSIMNVDLKEINIPQNNKIKRLYLEPDKNLKNLNQIKNLNHLEDLSIIIQGIKKESVTDLNWLSELTHLKKLQIYTGRQPIKSFDFLNSLKNLTYLDLSSHQVEHIPLGKLSKLETLKLSNMDSLKSLTGLAHLKNLKTLHIGAGQITALPGLGESTQLEDITLHMYKLNSLPDLHKLKQLKQLELNETRVSDLGFLQDTVNLEKIRIGYSPISSMKPLAKLVHIKSLLFSTTNIKEIEGLDSMNQLKSLTIRDSPITSLNGLPPIVSIEKLSITGLPIETLSNIDKLKNLKDLFLPNFKRTKENFEYLKKLEEKGIRLI